MDDTTFVLILILVASIALLLGAVAAHLVNGKAISRLHAEKAELKTKLEMERLLHLEKLSTMKQARDQLTDAFKALSGEALRANTEHFLHLAEENFKQLHLKSTHELEQREKSVEHMVKPIREALDKTQSEVRRMESERKEAFGAIHKHLETMTQAQHELQGETRNLVQALRRPEVRGRWGEMTLRRVVELAGMQEHCDFYEQESVAAEGGIMRPDMVVRMVERREVVVDAKTPLDAYLSAMEATDDEQRKQHLQHHARKLREHIRALSDKAYWNQFKHAPDFVVMFIPGEQFLGAALDVDSELLEEAMRRKIVLATPTSFMALLRSIAYGWRQLALAKNAEHIRSIGEDLYSRLATFSEHLARMGKSLDTCVANFNKAVSSYDTRILPGARKFTEMGITSKKDVAELEKIERLATPSATQQSAESEAKKG